MMLQNRTFIFVHGLGLSCTIWEPLKNLLNLYHITPDLLGHGKSPRGYSFASLWSHLKASLHPDDWKNSVLILHSMSSALLPEIIADKTSISAIVLIEGNIIKADAKWSFELSSMSNAVYKEYLTRIRKNSSLILRRQLYGNYDTKQLDHWSKGFTEVDDISLREIATNLFKRCASGEIIDALKSCDFPVCYLRGGLSEPWAEGRKLLTDLKVPIIDVEKSAHYPMIDNPNAIIKAVLLYN